MTKTKTQTLKCFKNPTCAIFLKTSWFKDKTKDTDKKQKTCFKHPTYSMYIFQKEGGSRILNIAFPPKKFTNFPLHIFHRCAEMSFFSYMVQMTNLHSLLCPVLKTHILVNYKRELFSTEGWIPTPPPFPLTFFLTLQKGDVLQRPTNYIKCNCNDYTAYFSLLLTF